jgi:membrane fusion protein, multidrug efflux system
MINYMKKTILVIGIIPILFIAACKSKAEEKKEAGKYTVTSPLLTDTCYIKEYVAQIQSLQNIEIRPKIDGYIETINVDEGQHVNAGQVLFTIRPKEYQAELLKANAEAKTAEIEMQNAKRLADAKVVSPTEMALAMAKLDEAKAGQSIAELNLSYTQIKAPFEGYIDRIHFKVGSLVDNSSLLTKLSNNKEVYAYFNVSEAEYLNYKAHQTGDDNKIVSLILANNQEFEYKGTIETIAGEFDNTTGSIAFRAKFPNPDLLLRNGGTGKVQMKVDIKNALIIPQKATYDIQDKIYVYVLGENNVLKSRNITVKQSLSNLYVIGSGLQLNDKILLEGVQMVKDDDKVETSFIQPRQVIQGLQLIKQ